MRVSAHIYAPHVLIVLFTCVQAGKRRSGKGQRFLLVYIVLMNTMPLFLLLCQTEELHVFWKVTSLISVYKIYSR